MRPGSRYPRWLALGFLLLCCLILVSLEFPVSRTQLANARSTSVRIMPLGDSITFGQGSSDGGGYRFPLWNALKGRGFAVNFVGSLHRGPDSFDADHEGRPGWKINQIAAEVVNWLKTYQPQIILLHIGTNDFVKNDNPAQASTRLAHLLDLMTATLPDAVIIVAQIIPLGRSATLNAEVVDYNATIPGIVQARAARGKHIHSVDMYHAVSPQQLPDGIHPDDTAYALMAKVWLQALLPLLSSANKSAVQAL